MIGICPQEDLLIFNMTVMENLYFFLGIKMIPVRKIEEFADKMLKDFKLETKKDAFVETLSGGQKRKL